VAHEHPNLFTKGLFVTFSLVTLDSPLCHVSFFFSSTEDLLGLDLFSFVKVMRKKLF